MDALTLHDVHAKYGKAHVLRSVTMNVKSKSITGLLGRNGAGKTTLLRTVMRLVPQSSGEIQLFGKPITELAPDAVARAGVAYMPQGLRVFPDLTLAENCQVAAHAVNSPRPLDEILELLPELKRLVHRRAGSLSGGEQQMLGVARSLTMRCQVLLMDEPTEGLAPRLIERISEICQMVAAEGVAVLLVEQNIRLAMACCDHVYIVEKGQVRAEGAPSDLDRDGSIDRFLSVTAG